MPLIFEDYCKRSSGNLLLPHMLRTYHVMRLWHML